VRELLGHGIVVVATAALGGCASAMPAEPSGLVVTEIAAAGLPEDWVEVLNVSDEPIDLDDFVVVDDDKKLGRARPLGAIMLAPGERHVRVLTDATVGFRLAGDEELWIFRADDGALIDGYDWSQGASPPGGSLARRSDVGAFGTVRVHTRGHVNRE
jgi:hypothetical protein